MKEATDVHRNPPTDAERLNAPLGQAVTRAVSTGGAMEAIALEPVDALTVPTLVDNVTDSLLPDQGPAKRPSRTDAPRMAARFVLGGHTDDALRAEHGFSALVTVEKAGRQRRVLFDAGRTPDELVENMRRLDLSPGPDAFIQNSVGTRYEFAAADA